MIQSFHERKKAEARETLEEAARELGYSLSDLAESLPKKTRKRVEPKYCNPVDPSQTWTGRGRKPRWIIAGLESGKTLDDMKIGD